MQNLGTGEIFIVVAVLFVLFGGKKLPELAKGLGEAGKEFNKAFKGESEPEKPTKTHTTSESTQVKKEEEVQTSTPIQEKDLEN